MRGAEAGQVRQGEAQYANLTTAGKRKVDFCSTATVSDDAAAFSIVSLPAQLSGSGQVAGDQTALELSNELDARVQWEWWVWPHLCSLDAPLVAVTWQWWWATHQKVRLPPSRYLVLGLAVWLIYLADRLADVARAAHGEKYLTDRHAFCARHRGIMRWLLAFVTTSLVVATPLLLSGREFMGGLVLLGTTAIYYWLIHHRSGRFRTLLPKEAVVGGLFSLGSAFFPACWLPASPGWFLVAVSLFGALCFLNCALITAWEQSAQDAADPGLMLNTFPCLGPSLDRSVIPLACCTLLLLLLPGNGSSQLWPIVLSAFLLGVLHRERSRWSLRGLRVVVDVALLTPLLALVWKMVSR